MKFDLLYPADKYRQNNFDFIRLLLAATVVFSHSYVIYNGVVDDEPMWKLSKSQAAFGTLSLNFFFIISGFLIAQSWVNSTSFISYLQRRITRIYPGFMVVSLFTVFIFGAIGTWTPNAGYAALQTYYAEINLLSLLKRCLLLQIPKVPVTLLDVPVQNYINGTLWSISYEFICYLIIPLLTLLGLFRKKLAPLLFFVVVLCFNIWHAQQYQQYNSQGIIDSNLLPSFFSSYGKEFINLEHFLMFFLAGMCFYFYRNYIPKLRVLLLVSVIIMLLSINIYPLMELAQSVFGSYILFYFIFSDKVKLHEFSRFGDFSYGIYLYGWPVQQLVMLYLGKELTVMGLFMVSMAIVTPIAAFSWFLIEKPALKLKNLPIKIPMPHLLKKRGKSSVMAQRTT
ncbi:acyltransferase family protein [Pontibacter sp. 13R65]|uniref:acyltransferase family protein n=1 Tax=Pontibacter sp. 13R65 TaxID=3127458 RepID=UPI00301C1502